jgi:hypothetical protein
MIRPRNILIAATTVLLAGLIVLSAVGACLGADRARAMFLSAPASVLWAALAVLTLVSVVASGRMIRRPDVLAMHLGALCVLAGGMWGSPRAHRWRARIGDGGKPPHGLMVLFPGERERRLFSEAGEPVGRLPFEIRLLDCRTLYRPSTQPARMALRHLPVGTDRGRADIRPLDLEPGDFAPLPAGGRLILHELVERAVPRRAGELIARYRDRELRLPALPGARARLEGVDAWFEVDRLLEDAAGAEVTIAGDDGRRLSLTVLPGRPIRQEGFSLSYEVEIRAEPDAESPLPAALVEVRGDHDGPLLLGWMFPDRPGRPASLPLEVLYESRDAWRAAGSPAVLLVKPVGSVREQTARVEALADGEKAAAATLRVNHPLHHRGYHVYLAGVGEEADRHAVLMAVADDGLHVVYAGFALLGAGAAGRFWVRPVVRRIREGR